MERRDLDPALLERLRATEYEMPADLRAGMLACGEAAVRPLAMLLEHEDCAALHAAELIRDLGPAPVVDELISALVNTEPEDPLWAALTDALAMAGPALVEPALRVCGESEWFFHHVAGLAQALARCGERDERIFQLLVTLLDEGDDLAPMLLADYGDRRGLRLVRDVLDARLGRPGRGPFTRQVLRELTDAIERLGGVINDADRRRIERFLSSDGGTRVLSRDEAPPARRQPGRNEPCWCGSGRKYKRCHLETDAMTVPPAW